MKNSLSTQLKKDDMEEFPSSTYHKMSNKKEHNKENQEDSAVFKYKEYKKLYFQETKPEKQKKQNNYVTEQIEEKDELLNFRKLF